MPKAVECPVCGGAGYSVVLDQKDSLYFARRIVKCGGCGLLYVNPQPDEDDLQALYDGELSGRGRAMFWNREKKDYVLHENEPSGGKAGAVVSRGADPVERRAKHRIGTLRKLAPPPRSALDIGCRDGCFLLCAKENGYSGAGIEISSSFAEIARAKTGFEIFSGTLERYAESGGRRKFDVVTLWDVIEHLPDPKAVLEQIGGLQERGGVLGISTVNLMNYRFRRHGARWRGFKESQEHIIFFSARTLSMLLEKCGYAPVRVVTRMIPAFHLKWLNLFRMGHVLEVYARKKADEREKNCE